MAPNRPLREFELRAVRRHAAARLTHAPPQPQRSAALLFDLVSRAGNKSSSRRRTPYSARAQINAPRLRHRRSTTPSTRVAAGKPCRPPPSPRTPTPRRPPPSPSSPPRRPRPPSRARPRRRRSSRRPPRSPSARSRARAPSPSRRPSPRPSPPRRCRSRVVNVCSTPSSFALAQRSTGSHAQAAAEPAKPEETKPAEEPKAAEPVAEPAKEEAPKEPVKEAVEAPKEAAAAEEPKAAEPATEPAKEAEPAKAEEPKA